MYCKNIFILSFLAAAFAVSLPACANISTEVVSKQSDTTSSDVDKYWTPERMKNAKPMSLPSVSKHKIYTEPSAKSDSVVGDGDGDDGLPPAGDIKIKPQQLYVPDAMTKTTDPKSSAFDRGTFRQEFSSSRLVPVTADLTYPYRAVGKLFFTIPGQGDFVCSASVLRPRVLVTAGHCVHSGSNGTRGFYTNWKFVPAFRDGTAPLQTWNANFVVTTSTWANGGGVVPNAADYAMLQLEDRNFDGVFRRIGTITGYFGYQTLSLNPNHAHLLGYPCNLDSCQKMHQVTAQSARATTPNNVEYGSDMRGGSSGGPWVQNFGEYSVGQVGGLNSGLNRIVGVTSYGYVSTDPKAQGASLPDSRFISVLNVVCGHLAGNC